MDTIGTLEEVWRYPVKSMRGEQLESIFVAFTGLMGDRIYGIVDEDGDADFPWHTAREQESLLLYAPRFVDAPATTRPVDLEAAQGAAPGVNPIYPDDARFALQVTSPDGQSYDVRDPAFVAHLESCSGASLRLHYTQKGQMDCRPVSLLSMQTVETLSCELDTNVDRRRFRANLYVRWTRADGYFEDSLVGRTLLLGDRVRLRILEKDPRCKMITLDPDTGAGNPALLRHVARRHQGCTGVYGAVLAEGLIRRGDPVRLV